VTGDEEQFAERLSQDLERAFGIGIALEGIEFTEVDGVQRVEVSILYDGRIDTIEAWAPDDSSLYRLLMTRAAELWRVSAFSGLSGPL